jgi:hypothetical protein
MRYPSLMVDLETMDTANTAAILAIGAVFFDPADENTTAELKAASFSRTISLPSNEVAGRTISASTVMWWMQQNDAARRRLYDGELVPLNQALNHFVQWIDSLKPKPIRLWAKDPDFDNSILANAFANQNMRWVFPYWSTRSVRTIIELAWPDGDKPDVMDGTAHDAIDDAIQQVKHVQLAYQKLCG